MKKILMCAIICMSVLGKVDENVSKDIVRKVDAVSQDKVDRNILKEMSGVSYASTLADREVVHTFFDQLHTQIQLPADQKSSIYSLNIDDVFSTDKYKLEAVSCKQIDAVTNTFALNHRGVIRAVRGENNHIDIEFYWLLDDNSSCHRVYEEADKIKVKIVSSSHGLSYDIVDNPKLTKLVYGSDAWKEALQEILVVNNIEQLEREILDLLVDSKILHSDHASDLWWEFCSMVRNPVVLDKNAYIESLGDFKARLLTSQKSGIAKKAKSVKKQLSVKLK